MRKGALIAALAIVTSSGAYAAPSTVQIVSAASSAPLVSPDSLATIYGTGLAPTTTSGALTSNGQLQTKISGVSVLIGNKLAGLLYISPDQINIWIPPGIPVGVAAVQVVLDSVGVVGAGSAAIAQTAPAIFILDCLRLDRGAIQNAVMYSLEPFAVTTESNPGSDKRTRLSLFGTGVRGAPTSVVSVVATNAGREEFPLEVEYSGPAPGFFGLDQINVVLPAQLDGAGLVNLNVSVGNQISNSVNLTIATSRQLAALTRDFNVHTIAGGGQLTSFSGVLPALQATLSNPLGVAIDSLGRLYIADSADNAIRMVSLDGTVSTVAGTGVPGFGGDGGPAFSAQLRDPQGVAVSPTGDIYIADTGNNRIRRIANDGTISTFAGNVEAGNSGDFGPAVAANLSGPTAVAVDDFLTVFIADTGNNRVRKVAVDGLIVPFAGTGAASYTGDGGSPLQATLNAPGSLAMSIDRAVYVADAGNFRVRRNQHGLISTYIGDGTQGSQSVSCGALSAALDRPTSLGFDQFGRVFLSDTPGGRIQMLDTDCEVHPIAGTGVVGYSTDPGPAMSAQFNQPAGLATTLFGEFYVADSANNRIRKLVPQSSDASCAENTPDIGFSPLIGVSGQTIIMQLHLPCAAVSSTTIGWTSSLPLANVPSSGTISLGQSQVSIPIVLPTVDQSTVVTVTTDGGTSGNFMIVPPTLDANGNPTVEITVSPNSVTGGGFSTGSAVIGTPAPAGGTTVSLTASSTAAKVVPQIVIPEGQVAAQFEILTVPVTTTQEVTVTGAAGNSTGQGTLILLANGLSDQNLSSLTFIPNPATVGGAALGTVALVGNAGPQGQTISLSSTSPDVSVPAAISVTAGGNSASFPILIGNTAPQSVLITATGPNTISGTLSINLAGTGNATISQLILQPSSVVGGNSVSGHIFLAQPAGSGGTVIELSSTNSVVSLPPSVTVPAGQSDTTFTAHTTPVSKTTSATISASAGNTISTSLTIQSASGGGPGAGTISNLSVSPTTVTAGQSSGGTVTLASAAGSGGVLVTLSSNNAAATVPASITIPQGQTSGTFTVSTSSVTSSTSALITATSANSSSAPLTINPSGAGTGTLSSVSLNPSTVSGGQSSSGTVTLASAAGSGGVLVTLSSNNAAATVPASLTIPQGQTSGTFTVSTSSVTSSTSALITATSANSSSAPLTINPVAPSTATLSGLTLNPTIVTAGQTSTGTVTLAAPAGAGGVLVNLASNSAAASVPSSIVVPQGQSSGTFTVSTSSITAAVLATITANSANSENATLLINPVGAGTGAVTGLSIAPLSVSGGQSATGTVTLGLPAALGGVQVSLSSNNAAATVPGSITIPEGQTSGNFTITTSQVSAATSALITATSGSSASATLTIDPAGPSTANLAGTTLNPTVVSAGQSSTGTVTLSAASGPGGVVVNLTSNSGAATVPGSITIPQGQSSGTFTVSTSSVTLSVDATITATSANSVNATLVINPSGSGTGAVSGVSVTPASVTGGQSATGTVTLALPAILGGVVVNLSSNNPSVTVPVSLTIPFGATTGNFTVSTSAVSTPTSVLITASSATSASTTFSVDP